MAKKLTSKFIPKGKAAKKYTAPKFKSAKGKLNPFKKALSSYQ